MIKLKNVCNGFVRIDAGEYGILCDPWLVDGLFDKSWYPCPPVQNKDSILEGATHCFISHIHADHYDLKTIDRMNRSVIMLIPDLYPNHLIQANLKKMGFNDVRMLKEEEPLDIGTDLWVEMISPMNKYGQEIELYKQNSSPSLVVDAGVLIGYKESKVVLLSDNTPYHPQLTGSTLERMKNCDIFAFAYNGSASDFPLCYDNLSDQEKDEISIKRETLREQANTKLIELLQPRMLIPYSADFALAGPMAKKFVEWNSGHWWTNREEAAQHYEETLNIPSIAIFEGITLIITPEKIEIESKNLVHRTPEQIAEQLYSPISPTREIYPEVEIESLIAQVEEAAQHMFDYMKRLKLSSDWLLKIDLVDLGWTPLYIDLQNNKVVSEAGKDRKLLTCRCESHYFAALIGGKTHWNNARFSFHLHWERTPNVFDRGIYDALNFFHIPRKKLSQSLPSKKESPVASIA